MSGSELLADPAAGGSMKIVQEREANNANDNDNDDNNNNDNSSSVFLDERTYRDMT